MFRSSAAGDRGGAAPPLIKPEESVRDGSATIFHR